MPLLLTPSIPFQTTAQVPVAQVYAIIDEVAYSRHRKQISFVVGYFVNEAACDARADQVRINALPAGFVVAATPEQADAVPIFQFLEQQLTAQLQALLPEMIITPDAPTAARYAAAS